MARFTYLDYSFRMPLPPPADRFITSRPTVWVCFLASVAACVVLWQGARPPTALSLLGLAILGAAGLLRARPSTRALAGGAGFVLVFVLCAWASNALREPRADDVMFLAAQDLLELLAAWSALLWLPVSTEPASAPAAVPRWLLPAGLGLAVAAVVVLQVSLNGAGTSGYTDEILYLLQARLFASGDARAPLPDDLRPFFALVDTVPWDGGLHTQYPPGWPLVLSLLDRVGLVQVAPLLVGLTLVASTWRVAQLLGGREVAAFALLALALDYHAIRWSAGLLAHGATAAAAMAMAACLLQGARSGRATWTVLGGLLGGLAVTIRPLTGLALGTAVTFWILLREPGARARWGRHLGALVAGGIVPALAFLAYNEATNGSPWTTGYTAAHAGSHSVGFGPQQRLRYAPSGEQYSHEFFATPLDALRRQTLHLAIAFRTVLPGSLLLPLLWFALRAGWRGRRSALVFVLLPAAYFFWATFTYRSISEVLPFVAIGVGAVLTVLWRRSPRWTAASIGLTMLALVTAIGKMHRVETGFANQWAPYVARVEQLAGRGRALVFVNRGADSTDMLFEKLSLFNARDWMGRVVVARDLGPRNVELQRRFPSHRPFRVTHAGWMVAADTVSAVPLCLAADCGARSDQD